MTVLCSADCHLMEPPNLWAERLPTSLRERAMRYEYTDTHRIWWQEGAPFMHEPLGIEGREDGTPITDDIDLRLKELDQDGIWAEMIFGNMGTLILNIADPAFAIASARVYNDYLAEAYGPHGERELPVAIVPVVDLDDAVAEIERVAALGLRSIGLPMSPPTPYFLEDYDCIWSAAEAAGLPVAFHVGTGSGAFGAGMAEAMAEAMATERGQETNATTLGIHLAQPPQLLVGTLVGSGTLARHPGLQALVVEAGAGWLAPLMEAMDFAWVPKVGHAREASGRAERGDAAGNVAVGYKQGGWKHDLLPSEYARQQVKVTFMDEPAPLKFLHVTGTEPLMWGSDFPHPEGTWPHSRSVVERVFADTDPAATAAITGGNLAALYGLAVPRIGVTSERVTIEGSCDPRFERVREVFAENWELFDEVGASIAVTLDGQPVVDLWGGWSDAAPGTRPWDRDTIVIVASTTKGLTGLCGNMLIDRGVLDPGAPVAQYWPEFAQNGKEGVLVEHLFDHRAGLPNMQRGVAPDDWDGVVGALATMRPRWEPGTAHNYHAATYGYLIGEVIVRITGTSVGTFLRHEVCEPLGVDAWIGVPLELDDRCADVCGQAAGMDAEALRRYESPAGNGHTNGRSLARIFGAMACGGEVDGIRLLSKQTLDDATSSWVTGPWAGFDERLFEPDGPIPRSTFGLRLARGFMKSSEMSWMGPNPGAFGSAGSGGSIAVADPDPRIGFGYAQNSHLGPLAGIDSRPGRVLQAVYAAL